MKNVYTRADIDEEVIDLDVRAQKLSQKKLDRVINKAFAEMTAITQAFQDEEVVSLKEFYKLGELQFTLDIEEDVTSVYDSYCTIEGSDPLIYPHGIKKVRDENVIYEDNRYNGKVHVNLDMTKENTPLDNVVIKYYYTPRATLTDVYMDAQTYLAFTFALGMALYDELHDVERAMQKRAGLDRTIKAIIPELPLDAIDPGKPSMFPRGV